MIIPVYHGRGKTVPALAAEIKLTPSGELRGLLIAIWELRTSTSWEENPGEGQ